MRGILFLGIVIFVVTAFLTPVYASAALDPVLQEKLSTADPDVELVVLILYEPSVTALGRKQKAL